MSNIVLSQTPLSFNCFIYPESDGTCALQIFPTSPTTHFDKVDDPRASPNDDTDYVFCNTAPPAILDTYNLSAHPPEATGVINYIQVFSRAKAYPVGQAATGEYKHKIISGTGNALSPNYAPLPASYQPYSTIWATNPATGLAWTWTEIDALLAGASISSPTLPSVVQTILRPNGASVTNLTSHGAPTNWECVDEETCDNDTTWVGTSTTSYVYDLYTMQDHTTENGIINYISLAGYLKGEYVGHSFAKFAIKTSVSAVQYSSEYTLPIQYSYFYNTWILNYDTAAAWTWDDIDALTCGVALKMDLGGHTSKCSQLYLIVNWLLQSSPELRMTQLYVMVNYSPNPSAVTLLAPNKARYANARKTERFIFPDGTYCIGDYGRGGKKLSLVGTENTNAIQRMRSVQAMLGNPSPVTISGLLDVNQDMQWRLKDFDFEYDIGGDHYDWTAELASYDYVEGSP